MRGVYPGLMIAVLSLFLENVEEDYQMEVVYMYVLKAASETSNGRLMCLIFARKQPEDGTPCRRMRGTIHTSTCCLNGNLLAPLPREKLSGTDWMLVTTNDGKTYGTLQHCLGLLGLFFSYDHGSSLLGRSIGRSQGSFHAEEDPSQRSRRKKNASSGENLEPFTAGQGNSDGKGALYNCNYCNKGITGSIRIKCAMCSDFDLCVECFSVGAERYPHKSGHPYRVMVLWSLDFKFAEVEGYRKSMAAKSKKGTTKEKKKGFRCRAFSELHLDLQKMNCVCRTQLSLYNHKKHEDDFLLWGERSRNHIEQTLVEKMIGLPFDTDYILRSAQKS